MIIYHEYVLVCSALVMLLMLFHLLYRIVIRPLELEYRAQTGASLWPTSPGNPVVCAADALRSP